MLRSILVSMIVFGSIPAILVRPDIGVLVYSWVSYMYPQQLSYGFIRSMPIALIIGSITFVSWLISREKKIPSLNSLVILIIIMAIWISITTILALNYDEAIREWNLAIKVLAISVLTTILMQDRRRITLLVWVIVVSLGYYAFRGALNSLFSGGAYRLWGPDGSYITDNNSLALALLTVIPLLRYLHLQTVNRWLRLGLLSAYPAFLLAVITSYSRGAFLGLGVMLAYLAMKSRRRVGFGILLVVMIPAVFSIMPEKYFNRLGTIESYQEDGSAQGRLNAWYFAMNFTMDHPIFGGGFKVSDLRSLWHYAPNPERVQVAHSIYFEMLETQGFPGLFFFLAIIFLSMHYSRWVARRTKGRADLTWIRDLASCTEASIVGFCAGGAFLSLQFYDLFWHLVAITVICRILAERELAKPVAVAGPVGQMNEYVLKETPAYPP
jgi:probable O-glycosylation ligase (exosortase A-associated)